MLEEIYVLLSTIVVIVVAMMAGREEMSLIEGFQHVGLWYS